VKIVDIIARQILDSRGTPTVEADVILQSGIVGRAAVPSGASTGVHEAVELRDGGKDYDGKGVTKAVANIKSEIADKIRGMQADDQYLLDETLINLDGTTNKSRLGANSILAVSLAAAKAASEERKLPFYKHINDIAQKPQMSIPMPMMNVLNGGKHASNSSDFQEFMVIPVSAKNYSDAVRIGVEIFMALKKIIASAGLSTAVGDEGGFTYPVKANTQMLELLNQAGQAAGYKSGQDYRYAVDVASSEFYKDGVYTLAAEGLSLSPEEMIGYIEQACRDYPIESVEDGLDQDAWEDWALMTNKLRPNVQLVGDDLFVTNSERLQKGVNSKAGNAILIKPNQIGTLTETIRAIQLARQNGWNTIISHRSGETEDVSISHLAVGTGAGQIKTGSLSRTERTAKHNELMRIEASDASLLLNNPFK